MLSKHIRHFSWANVSFTKSREQPTFYDLLKVKTTSNQKEIKLAYYRMAKLHHPDFQVHASEQQKALAEEHFKDVVKAYETLSCPISRQSYDIENRINEGVNLDQSTFEDSTSKKNYFQPRTQTDFYHTKWTGYKKPDWYHPYNGIDNRSEYLYTKRINTVFSPRQDIALEYLESRRLAVYLALFAVWNLYDLYNRYRRSRFEAIQMEILESSFGLDLFLQTETEEEKIELDGNTMLALENYIRER